MRENNYYWNSQTQQYEYQVGEVTGQEEAEKETSSVEPEGDRMVRNIDNQEELLQLLLEDKDKLLDILKNENHTLPRYRLPGLKRSKYVHISHLLEELLREFCEENGISQREFVEIALIKALEKYGYKAEVKGILNG